MLHYWLKNKQTKNGISSLGMQMIQTKYMIFINKNSGLNTQNMEKYVKSFLYLYWEF